MSLTQASRRPGFQGGIEVELSDGAKWMLPIYENSLLDAEHATLVVAAMEAEDRAEVLRIELALTILLLGRNYELSPDQMASLLTFPPNDARQLALQGAVHDLVLRYAAPARSIARPPTVAEEAPRGQTLLPGSM